MVDGMVIKVCSYGSYRHIVGRMLHRCEGIYFFANRKNNNSARMLAGSTAHANAAGGNTLNFCPSVLHAMFFVVF